jgi:hypothetical protein
MRLLLGGGNPKSLHKNPAVSPGWFPLTCFQHEQIAVDR